MKTRILLMLLTGGVSLAFFAALAQTESPPASRADGAAGEEPPPGGNAVVEPGPDGMVQEAVEPDVGDTAAESEAADPEKSPTAEPAEESVILPRPASDGAGKVPGTPAGVQPSGGIFKEGAELRLNLRDAPIEMVLNHLADAAGFVIELNTKVSGKVDVWSSRPVSTEEAVTILNSVLNRNGYAAVRNDRILTIMTKAEAMRADIPVKIGNDPAAIPRNSEIVTQIIPIRFVEAQQLVKELSPMVSSQATIIANEAGNSITVTDTQANIRHLVEIIKAIDSSAEDVSEVRVFPLKHHDPAEIAALLNGMFSDQGATTTTPQAPVFFGRHGDRGDWGGASSRGGQDDRIKKRSRVVAVADQRTSSVVVTASRDMIGQITGMIEQLDQESPKVAKVSVIHLENADPKQVQEVLQDMFQSTTSSRGSSSQNSLLMDRIRQGGGTTSSGTTLGGSSQRSSRSGSGG